MAGQADRRFVKHPPWVKIPIPDRGNLRSQFSKLDADERCLILDIEDNCEAIWYSGMRIGESWKEIAEEQYLMFMAKHGQRYAQEANKIFAIRLKRHIENYCQFYASQLDLSIDQAVKQSQGGHHTQETLKNKKQLEDSCEVSSSLAEGKLEDSFKQKEEEKEKEQYGLLQDHIAQEQDKESENNFAAQALGGAWPPGPKINETMLNNFFYLWGKHMGDQDYSPSVSLEYKQIIQSSLERRFKSDMSLLKQRINASNYSDIDDWCLFLAEED